LHPTVSVSDLTRDIKANSSKFINEKKWFKGKFNWQDGYGSFSYSKSQINDVAKYILNQPNHHKKRSFKEEYLKILKNMEIDYDEQYLFSWIE
jgi:putative transposase